MTTFYFAYGANMSLAVLERRGIVPLSAERARLPGWRLVFNLRGLPVLEPAFASIEPAEGAEVHGVLYLLRREDATRLDSHESPKYETIEVDVEGALAGRTTARVYRNTEPVAGLTPSRRYLRLLCKGARHHGLPEAYVERLEKHPAAYVPGVSDLLDACWGALLGMQRRRVLRARARAEAKANAKRGA